jgi:hypothetical protein
VAFVFTSLLVNFDNPISNRKPNKSNHMKILVLGVTGRTGELIAQLATAKNHKDTATSGRLM